MSPDSFFFNILLFSFEVLGLDIKTIWFKGQIDILEKHMFSERYLKWSIF